MVVMGTHTKFVILLSCWQLSLLASGADLKDDLYTMAKNSRHLTHLTAETFQDFIDSSDTGYVAVLFHIGTCHICKDALPTLEHIAKDYGPRADIAIGHLDCTSDSKVKEKFHLNAFPVLRFYRRTAKDNDQAWVGLAGKTVRVTSDTELIVTTSRQAGMSAEKNARRIEAAGKQALLQTVALEDYTVQAALSGVGRVWLPFEAIVAMEDGAAIPRFSRYDRMFQYRPKSWKREALQDFLERMMQPVVSQLTSRKELEQKMKDESQAALVLCAPEVREEMLEVAKAWQDQHRFLQAASPEACPLPQQDGKPQLIVYSAAAQQWSPVEGSARAAAVVAGSKVVESSWGELASWVNRNRFPGLWEVGYDNFPDMINSPRHCVLTAVDPSREEENKRVMKALREAASPRRSTERGLPDVYATETDSFQWGVVDGTLNGLDSFGIMKWGLPRAVVLEDRDHWVEDEYELRVWTLKDDLKNLGTMWRQRSGLKGYAVWLARDMSRMWTQIDAWAQARGGNKTRLLVIATLLCGMFLAYRACARISAMLVRALLAGDAEEEHAKQS